MENQSGQDALTRTLLSRRRLLLGATGVGFAALLAACGDDDDAPTATTAPADEATATTEPEATEPVASAFPVTIDHKHGSTTLEEAPERIVLVGLVEQDALLALGVVPVATREWYGGRPGAIFPWAEDLLGSADVPVVLDSAELDFEQISALQPDVIVGLYAGITAQEYETLSQIAPTVAQPEEFVDWGIPWQDLTLSIGDIVGKRAEAEALVEGVEETFANYRAENPEFAGASAAVASAFGLPENFWVFSSQDVRGRLISSLGFVVPTVFDEMAGESYGAVVSAEQFDLLADLDVLIWASSADPLEDIALYQALPPVQEGRVLYYDESNPVYDAFNFGSVVSLPFLVEQIVPDIVEAMGDA